MDIPYFSGLPVVCWENCYLPTYWYFFYYYYWNMGMALSMPAYPFWKAADSLIWFPLWILLVSPNCFDLPEMTSPRLQASSTGKTVMLPRCYNISDLFFLFFSEQWCFLDAIILLIYSFCFFSEGGSNLLYRRNGLLGSKFGWKITSCRKELKAFV